MTRSAWIILSIALIIIVGILFITQSKTLSDTQADLATVQAALTTQANAAVATVTQAAVVQAQAVSDTQQEAATTQAQALMDSENQASTAQAQAMSVAQNEAATAQSEAVLNARVEATRALVRRIAQVQDQAATAQARALDEAAATAATAQAQAVSDAENNAATATVAQGQAQIQADSAATQAALAENNAATATIAQGQAQIQADSAATVQADLQATISALEARLSEAAAPPAVALTPTESAATISREGWQRIEGNGVALQLPENWFGGDLLNNPDAIAEAITALGSEYEQFGQLFQQNPDIMRLMAFDQDSPPNFITNVNVIREELALTLTLSAYLDLAVPQLPVSLTVLENEIVQVNGREAGRLVITGDFPVGPVQILQYSIIADKQVWVVTYTTTTSEFETMLPIFEASFETFETQSSSA